MVRDRFRSVLFCALAWSSVQQIAAADDLGRNCPVAEDQVILVASGQPVAFRLNIKNADTANVSIFQAPLGGILQQAGPTPLDFVFVPEDKFNGTTTFTYRLTPPVACGHNTELHKVTFAGGTATSTAAGLPARPEDVCGAGTPLAFLMPAMALGVFMVRRRR